MRAPGFWQTDGILPRLLAPFAFLYAATTARRMAHPGWRAPVPVICIGNATAGGTGKTTVALDIGARLIARRLTPAFLTRGYGGDASQTRRIDPTRDTARAAGDEALLLAAVAPTYAGANRAAIARMAVEWGAQSLIMDDGLQNPTLAKDLAFLVIDGPTGFGNGRVIPAGPLREAAAAAIGRCQAAVIIGPDAHNIAATLPIPTLHAHLRSPADIAGQRLYAFAGIGRPAKFFDSLTAAGADLAGTKAFPDHHRFAPREFDAVLRESRRFGADPATTQKDAVRLTPSQRAQVRVIGVDLVWDDPAALETLLDSVLKRAR